MLIFSSCDILFSCPGLRLPPTFPVLPIFINSPHLYSMLQTPRGQGLPGHPPLDVSKASHAYYLQTWPWSFFLYPLSLNILFFQSLFTWLALDFSWSITSSGNPEENALKETLIESPYFQKEGKLHKGKGCLSSHDCIPWLNEAASRVLLFSLGSLCTLERVLTVPLCARLTYLVKTWQSAKKSSSRDGNPVPKLLSIAIKGLWITLFFFFKA